MDVYTEFCFNASLIEDTRLPRNIPVILKYLTNGSAQKGDAAVLPGHKFFKTKRFKWLLTSDSNYFVHKSQALFFRDYDKWLLNVHSNVMNYDNEIELFLDWISIYVTPPYNVSGCLGFICKENADEPQFIYYNKLKNYLKEKVNGDK